MKKAGYIRSILVCALSTCLSATLFSCGGGGGDSGSTAGASGSIVLTADPASIDADGTSSSTITATIKDSAGNPVRHYTYVIFTTTLGRFRNGSYTIDVQTQPPLGANGLPDRNAPPTGIVTVALTAGTTSGTAKVTAKSNNVSQSVEVTIGCITKTGAITLAADPTSISADGTTSSTITATLTDSSGAAVCKGTVVVFTTTLGSFSNGSTTYSATTPDATGIVNVSLISGTTPGTATVKAASDSVTQSTAVTFTRVGNTGIPVAEEFSLSASYLNISGLWMASLEDTITASLADVYGNTVKNDTIVYFKTYNTGGILEKDLDVTSGGFASSILYTAGEPTPLQGFAFVTAETVGGATTRVTAIEATPFSDQHIMYTGTNGGGVYKSTDNGASWETASRSTENQKRGQNLIDPYVKGHSGICVDPDDHNTIYVGTGYLGQGNVYRSLDGGMNWNSNNVEEFNGLYNTTAAILAVVCDGDDDADTDYPYVWIGTEGRGPLFATDGKTFQPSGGIATTPVAGSGNTGNGTMSDPVLSYSSKTEDWTATCVVTDGTATLPQADSGNTGDGTMSAITTSGTTKTEDWTVTYKAVAGSVTFTNAGTATNKGNVRNIILTNPNAATETWTLTCTSTGSTISGVTGTATAKGTVTGISVANATQTETFTLTCKTAGTDNAEFELVGSKSGTIGDFTSNGVSQTVGNVTLTISEGSEAYAAGENFIFTSTVGGTFSVQSSAAGFYPDASVGTTYSEDGLSFIINAGTDPFEADDKFTFTTTASWQVSGTVSGIQTNTATTGTAYTSDDSEVGFTITAGGVPFVVNDKFTFSTTTSNTYWNVTGSVSGTQTRKAYNGELYYADDREVYFTITAGTTAFATGDTFTFSVTANALNHGWTVWDLVKVPDTHGSTAILYAATATGLFKTTNGAQTWTSLTSFTGDYVVALALYPTATGGSSDIIYAGTQNAGVWVSTNSGTTWTQYTSGMDSGRSATIKDILVDPANYKLYVVTYTGPVDAATGKVYVHALNSNGTMTSGSWGEAGTGLSGGALYALAAGKPSDPTALFAGGEGIKLYKASSGLSTGSPSWADSSTGLSNTIMARMPVLFSGEVTMSISQTALANSQYYYEVYIQDTNGNPPITGSTFTAITYDSSDAEVATVINKTYGDSITNSGTYRDPSDPTTNNPFAQTVDFSGSVAKIIFTFTPKCETVAPGCSGSAQTATYSH